MKNHGKILILFLFLLSFSYSQAQDKNNPWAISVGSNAVDFYPVGAGAPQGGLFQQFFHAENHWNMPYAFDKVSVAHYIGSGLSGKIDGSINKIKKYGNERLEHSKRYYALNGGVDYSLGYLLHDGPEGWFDPYFGLGLGATWIKEKAALTGNVEIGFNFWATDRIGIEIGTVYRGALNHNHTDYSHFQHSVGVKFAFGGKDSDGDGVYDAYDDCPDEPGLKEFNGCPDTDGDGIPDKDDECPDEAGLPEFNGCPDFDGDGVPDKDDECPEEPGLPEFNGCPDTDEDGIPDKDDECPDESGPKENNGCPWPDEKNDTLSGTQGKEVINKPKSYSQSVTFALGKAMVTEKSQKKLHKVAEEIKKYPSAYFRLAGYTDNTGSRAINAKLSKQRADAVHNYLVKQGGIKSDRLSANGYGSSSPVASNKTPEDRQKNRRVEIKLQKDKKK